MEVAENFVNDSDKNKYFPVNEAGWNKIVKAAAEKAAAEKAAAAAERLHLLRLHLLRLHLLRLHPP